MGRCIFPRGDCLDELRIALGFQPFAKQQIFHLLPQLLLPFQLTLPDPLQGFTLSVLREPKNQPIKLLTLFCFLKSSSPP